MFCLVCILIEVLACVEYHGMTFWLVSESGCFSAFLFVPRSIQTYLVNEIFSPPLARRGLEAFPRLFLDSLVEVDVCELGFQVLLQVHIIKHVLVEYLLVLNINSVATLIFFEAYQILKSAISIIVMLLGHGFIFGVLIWSTLDH